MADDENDRAEVGAGLPELEEAALEDAALPDFANTKLLALGEAEAEMLDEHSVSGNLNAVPHIPTGGSFEQSECIAEETACCGQRLEAC